jgi:hypothetical protein
VSYGNWDYSACSQCKKVSYGNWDYSACSQCKKVSYGNWDYSACSQCKREEVNGLWPMPVPFEMYAWLQVWYSGRQVHNCQ